MASLDHSGSRTTTSGFCDNQHRAICPGAWQVLDSTWSTEKGRQGPPVVPTGLLEQVWWFVVGALLHNYNDLACSTATEFVQFLVSVHSVFCVMCDCESVA